MLKNLWRKFLIGIAIFYLSVGSVLAQDLKYERARYKGILDFIKSEIEKKYYDPQFHGVDLTAKHKLAVELVNKSNSPGEMLTVVAQFMLEFNDSHTFFIPPQKVAKIEYGWEMSMIGDKCFVTEIEPESDAAKQGLKIGDQVYWIEGFEPTRENIWKIDYYYHALNPQPALRVIVIKPDKKKFQYFLKAKVTQGKSVVGVNVDDWKEYDRDYSNELKKQKRNQTVAREDGLFIWRMPSFSINPNQIDQIMGKVKGSKNLILDLRGNGGGYVVTLDRFLGYFFTKDVKIADSKFRKETKSETAQARGKNAYAGNLIVLVDSSSASAAEMFARVIQLEKRGIVIGDQSSGKVMTSQFFEQKDGVDYVAYYGYSVTVAEVIMKDGKSLENVGVIPDENLIPTALDLAAERDPVLAKAAQLLGYKMTSEEAGKVFPKEPKP